LIEWTRDRLLTDCLYLELKFFYRYRIYFRMDRIALLFVLVRLAGAESHVTQGFSLMQKDIAAGKRALVRDDADHKKTVALVQNDADHKETDGFVLTWEVPAVLGARPSFNVARWINVTSLEARQMTGPLTLLLAFRICESAKALQPVLKKVRQKGQAHVHLIGVRDNIEPEMAWKRFLVGPLTDRDQVLVDAFGLPRTPLAGVAVSVLFNGEELSSTKKTGGGGLFNEARTSGVYHKTVTQVPDLVVALNPGFTHYLGNWWHTLRHLWHSQVPIVTTGYGHAFSGGGFALPALYNLKYDAEDATRLEEDHKTVSLLSQPQSGADPATLPDIQTFPVKKQQSASNTACAESRSFVGLPQHNATVCSDREGDALVAGQAGFEVLVTIKNPFVYCTPFTPFTAAPDCQGSEVLHVFDPKKADRHASEAMMIDRKLNTSADRMEKSEMEEVPDGLAMQIMRQSLTCYEDWTEHPACMERRLQHLEKKAKKKALPRKARLWVYDFMDRLAMSCAERDGDKYDQVALDQVTSFH